MTIREKISGSIDSAVSFFSPRAGLKRRMYREAIKVSENLEHTVVLRATA